MAGYRWDGAQWTELTNRRQWQNGQWKKMAGYRWDGAQWVELWPPPGGIAPPAVTELFFNLDESPVVPTDPFTFNLTKEPQIS